MKKSSKSAMMAARFESAANKPAGRGVLPAPAPVLAPVLVSTAPAANVPESAPVQAPAASAAARLKAKKTKLSEPDTIPITLRPSNALLSKYVMKAAERTREEGRVVSAQQIMIEALERSV